MRKLLLFPALIFSSFAAMAEVENSNANTTGTPSVGGIFPHFSQSAGNNNRGIPTNLRMIAKSYSLFKDGGFVAVDSTTYQYNNGRGGLPRADDMHKDDHVLFDVSVKYKFNSSIWGYENEQRRQQLFTVNNKVTSLVYEKWHQLTSAWKNAERYTYTYDNNGKMQSSLFEQWYGALWTNGLNSTLNYDNNNNVIFMNSTTYNVDFVYDVNNNLITVQDRIWAQGIGWSNNERKSYTYSGKDVVGYTLEKWLNGGWVFTQSWQYKYDVSSNVIQTIEYEWNGNGWTEVMKRECTYDVDNNKLEEVQSLWNVNAKTFEPRKREVRMYNSKSLPESIISYTWNGQTWVHNSGDFMVKYYYEHYFPTAINSLPTDVALNVYPIPANDYVNVAMSLDESVTISVNMIDMTGRVVYQQIESASGNYSHNIPVHHLPSGNYVVQISDGSFVLNKKISVVD